MEGRYPLLTDMLRAPSSYSHSTFCAQVVPVDLLQQQYFTWFCMHLTSFCAQVAPTALPIFQFLFGDDAEPWMQ
eukprot:scaffold139260_cov15-Tisochrysis_lutea.AAC.2